MPRKSADIQSLSHFEDGRDSIQFAEFPLAILADSAPSNLKTVEFEDEIEDWATGKVLRRKVSITGSDKYGLPTAKDEDVLLALIQLTKRANDFTNPEVRFTKREIIDLLGWPSTGWSYDRVEESLHRWKGVSVHHFNAWRDNANKCWKNSVALGVIEYTEIESYSTDRRSAVVRAATKSCIIWNTKLFASLSSGYVKKLNFAVYRSLKRSAAKRAYRFLDKRFFHSPTWEFDLKTFACEKLGLSRAYDTGQLKERLKPALDELHDIGFIEPVKYRKQRPKQWTIAVAKKDAPKATYVGTIEQVSLRQELIAREVGETTAIDLVKKFAERKIREKITFFDSLVAKSDKRIEKNPPGFLIAAIKRDFKPTKSDAKSLARKSAKPVSAPKDEPIEERSKEEIDCLAKLSKLSPDGILRLTQQALEASTPFQVATFERLHASSSQLLEEFRLQLILSYIRESGTPAA
jgi:hypothetical protein